jgi:hypothetical protein
MKAWQPEALCMANDVLYTYYHSTVDVGNQQVHLAFLCLPCLLRPALS